MDGVIELNIIKDGDFSGGAVESYWKWELEYLVDKWGIAANPERESGILKILEEKEDCLSEAEKETVVVFRTRSNDEVAHTFQLKLCQGFGYEGKALKNRARNVHEYPIRAYNLYGWREGFLYL